MNTAITALGLETWKALLAPLLLPPTPFLMLVLVALAWAPRHRVRAWTLALLACAGLWFTGTAVLGEWLSRQLLGQIQPLSQADLQELARAHRLGANQAVLVLGSGVVSWRSELGQVQPSAHSLARLRHGLWIARQTGLPVAYSGGASYLSPQAAKEAHVAQRVATEEWGQPLRWTEDRSRDTRENASYSVPLLQAQGVHTVVLVTHGWHMRRALRAFQAATVQQGASLKFVPAPMDVAHDDEATGPLAWLPSAEGLRRCRDTLRELIGLAAGA